MKLFTTLLLLLPLITITTADDDFRLVDHQTLEFTNRFRANAKLKITFTGGNITHTDHKQKNSWSLVMDWDPKATGNATHYHNVVNVRNTTRTTADHDNTLYHFNWYHSGREYPDQEICFDLSFNGASWYSTALEKEQPWPFNTGKPFGPTALKTGSYESVFGPVIENVFLTSDGMALFFSQYYPDFVERKAGNKLCTTVRPAHHDPRDKLHYVSISFEIFATKDLAALHRLLLDRYYIIGRESPKGSIPDERMFNHTSYTLDARTLKQAEVISKVTELSAKLGLKNLQIVLEGWEAVMGDLKWDKARFPDPAAMVAAIHKLGYIVKLTVNSFYNINSDVFKSHPHFFLVSPTNHSRPYTFSWKDPSAGTSAANINQTGSLFNYPAGSGTLYHSRDWLVDRLKDIERFEKVDSFRFVGGDLGQFGVPEAVRTDAMRTDHYSNEYTRYYAATGNWLGGLVDLDAGARTQIWRNFLRLRDISPDWTSLKNLIPHVLTVGLAGYPYALAPTLSTSLSTAPKPTEELYIRWLQLTTFFASMQLSSGVSLTPKAANLTTAFLNLHAQHAPTLIAEAHAGAKQGGLPLLRPLWYLTPNDPKTYSVADQFAVGSDIIVAPVVTAGAKERTVYLTTGNWVDQHGKTYSGPGEVKVLAPLEELPYFKRKV